ncbi:hypothetical protein BaRGS_00033178, partial [Batillaria attramentaria]
VPTASFGEIHFASYGNQVHGDQHAKYVRVHKDTDMNTMETLLMKVWKLRPPKLVISVTGGAKDFHVKKRLKEAFRRGLRRAAQIPAGTHAGAMKHVGRVVRDCNLTREQPVTAIGIATWGCVYNRKQLESNGGGNWPVHYEVDVDDSELRDETLLDPNYSHFILVDDGTERKFGREIEFRTNLEQMISKQIITSDEQVTENRPTSYTPSGTNVPVALLVLEGGPKTLETVQQALDNTTPVIVIKGSGRCADVLAFAVQNASSSEKESGGSGPATIGDEVESSLREMVMREFNTGADDAREHVEVMKRCVRVPHLITVYDLDAKGKSGVDVAIIKGLLKKEANKKKGTRDLGCIVKDFLEDTVGAQLELALAWNRVDVAKSEIFTENRRWKPGQLDGIMMSAITHNNTEFVELILYNDFCLNRGKDTESKGVGTHKELHFESPAQELFLWAVLMNQQDMAKLFWRRVNEPTAAALVAYKLLKAIAARTHDTGHVLQSLHRNAQEFEDLAVDLLNKCFHVDQQKTQDLLVRKLQQWGNASCVLIALKSSNKRFISQSACQALGRSVWNGKVSPDTCFWKDPGKEKSSARTACCSHSPVAQRGMPSSENKMTACEKVKEFYTAPMAIFSLNFVAYLVFLSLYSYLLLVKLSPSFHFLEVIILVWIFTIFAEELRQVVAYNVHSVRSNWKKCLDACTVAVFFVGVALRLLIFVPCYKCYEVGRVILSINLVQFCVRLLFSFAINKELGPKVVMIRRMITDLMWFFVILLVFVFAYTIASEAILYPNTEVSLKLLYYLPRKAYWQIYGELFLDELEGDAQCTNNRTLYSGYKEHRCPSAIGQYMVPIMMAVYVLVTNVLLLNLLIAMFSYTFQKVQDNTDIHWHFQRFNLIFEYSARPCLPPPLIIFSYIRMAVVWCCKKACCKGEPDSRTFNRVFEEKKNKELVRWEDMMVETYLSETEATTTDSVQEQVKGLAH